MSWLFVAGKALDIQLLGAIMFYSFPVSMLLIVPCYRGLQFICDNYPLPRGLVWMLPLVVTLLQTLIAGQLLHVQTTRHVVLFFTFLIAAYTFSSCQFWQVMYGDWLKRER